MMQAKVLRSAGVQASAAVATLLAGMSVALAAAPPPTTPSGVTLVEVVRELGNSQPQVLWLRPGDALGHTLLISDKDDAKNARCVAECATEFPPLLASRGAKATGDWSLVRRQDGGSQWAYQGHPLYSWSKELKAGEVATNIGLTDTSNFKLAEGAQKPTSLMPPSGWQVARFTPAASMALPDGIDARVVYSYDAVALTDVGGRTLYTFDGDAKRDNQVCTTDGCNVRWLPVAAPALASTVGDFTVVSRADGSLQWAFKKRPLYAYSGDELPGDINGVGVDKKWAVAMLTKNFQPPTVGVVKLEGYGDTMASNGMTLYGGYAFGKRWGGRNLRDTFKDAYHKGKELGATACDEPECLKSWHPFLAAANAQSSGFWEPIAREDGTRQWAYKGFAMYTYAADKAPGDHIGQAIYDFKKPEGSDAYLRKVAFYEKIGKSSGGAGIYWNIAKP
jgi:predicted lipoprotein with Yx(FWY)xxD motif